MTKFVSRASIINLTGAAGILAACVMSSGMASAPWQDGPASARPGDEKQAKTGAIRGGVVQKGREGVGRLHGDPHVQDKDGTRVVASPELTACSSGTATACRAIETGMAGGLWSWKEGNVTAMDDWEAPVAARSIGNLKYTPAKRGVERGAVPVAVTAERVLSACDGGDVSACAAFAASVQPGRSHTGGR